MVDFEYDYNDGEVRPTIDFPLEDAKLTSRQVHRCLTTIARVLDEFYEVIQYTIETGQIHSRLEEDDLLSVMEQIDETASTKRQTDDPEKESLDEIKGNLEELRGLISQLEGESQSNIDSSDTEQIDASSPTVDSKKAADDDFEWI